MRSVDRLRIAKLTHYLRQLRQPFQKVEASHSRECLGCETEIVHRIVKRVIKFRHTPIFSRISGVSPGSSLRKQEGAACAF